MGELRDRMVRDMDLRNFSPRTVESYVDQVRGLAKYYRRPPDQLSNDEIQRYCCTSARSGGCRRAHAISSARR